MTDVAETIATDAYAKGKGDCWFCSSPAPESELQNKLTESPPSGGGADFVPENQLANRSSVLGKNIKDSWRKWVIRAPHNGTPAVVTPAAHHLIPGNASLGRATSLHKYMKKSRGLIRSDIGYDVNASGNGVWLPGSYGVRPEVPAFRQTWSAYPKQNEYAIAAMSVANCQFHDSHPTYSGHVLRSLRALSDKLNVRSKDGGCPVCRKKMEDKARPPYGLVGKLDGISRRYSQLLTNPKRKRSSILLGYRTSNKVLELFRLNRNQPQ